MPWQPTSATAILGNRIFQNTGLGIDLGNNGVTPNDANDADTGANNLQNFPVITAITHAGGMTTIQGRLHSAASTQYRIEFFDNAAGDLGVGEGQFFLGTTAMAVMTDALGNATFMATFPTPASGGHRITATATDPGNNTSEFGCSLLVTNTANSGAGSLREAIECANMNPGLDTITFNLPVSEPRFYYTNDGMAGQVSLANVTATTAATDAALVNPDPDWPNSWWSIRPTTPMPTITDAVIIDGYSQTGPIAASVNSLADATNAILRIEIDGGGFSGSSGLSINATGSTLRGLVINRRSGSTAIGLNGNTNVVAGNFLGTDVSGTLGLGNANGVLVSSSGNTIGGLNPADRNLISGNSTGIALFAGPNSALGNLIGTDRTGTRAIANSIGINALASGTKTIGGTAPGSRNIISGNATGISHQGTGTAIIQGNYIGTTADGAAAPRQHRLRHHHVQFQQRGHRRR